MSNETNKTNYASGANQGKPDQNKLSPDKLQVETKTAGNGVSDKSALNQPSVKSENTNSQDQTGPSPKSDDSKTETWGEHRDA